MTDEIKLFGVADLCDRWGYAQRHSIYQKMKLDKQFPKPIAKINRGKNLVWLESAIIPYEELRKLDKRKEYVELGCVYKCYNQTKEEWEAMSETEQARHN